MALSSCIPVAADPLAEICRWDAAADRFATPCGDGEMVWRSWGSGRPLLLLHGGAGSWRHWIRNLEALSPGRRIVAPDLPGLGESAAPPPPWSLDEIAGTVAQGLETAIGPRQTCDVIGFSFGSLVAGALASQLKARIGALILVGASGLGVARGNVVLEKVRSLQGTGREAAHRVNLSRLMIADPLRIDAQAIAIQAWNSDHARLRSVGLSTGTVLLDRLPSVSAKVCALWGTRDAVAIDNLEQRVRALRAVQPAAEIHLIPRAGHWLAYEAAEQFNAITREFLAKSNESNTRALSAAADEVKA
jgi:pimeloyl-ACP methyl ester carboxylesterase